MLGRGNPAGSGQGLQTIATAHMDAPAGFGGRRDLDALAARPLQMGGFIQARADLKGGLLGGEFRLQRAQGQGSPSDPIGFAAGQVLTGCP